MNRVSPVIFLVILSSVSVLSESCFSGTPIMKVSEVRAGMRGYGLTVVRNRLVETFEVEIMGVLKNNKLDERIVVNGSSILVRVSGKLIEEAGGIAAGMSGSPVYVDGKLLGAISSGWVLSDHSIGMVTPIEDMLKLFNYPEKIKTSSQNAWVPLTPVEIMENGVRRRIKEIRVIHEGKNINECEIKKGIFAGMPGYDSCDGVLYFVEAASPLLISGLSSPRAVERLRSVIRGEMVSVPGNGGDFEISENPELKPGQAIAVQLARGDMNITALGTLTYVDGDRFLAFGHPIINRGRANFFLTEADIFHCFASVSMPFKVGSPGPLAGCVTQDRNQGIAGRIGSFPEVVNLSVRVEDEDTGDKNTMSVHLVQDSSLISTLISTAVTQAISDVLNREGGGTARTKFKILVSDGAGESYTIQRENMFLSSTDIAGAAVVELLKAIEFIDKNPFKKLMIFDIKVDIRVTEKEKKAEIVSIEIPGGNLRRGGYFPLCVRLRPYRSSEELHELKVLIPAGVSPGRYLLTVGRRDAANDECIEDDSGLEKKEKFFDADRAEIKRKKENSEKNPEQEYERTLRNSIEKFECQEMANALTVTLEPLYSVSEKEKNEPRYIKKELSRMVAEFKKKINFEGESLKNRNTVRYVKPLDMVVTDYAEAEVIVE